MADPEDDEDYTHLTTLDDLYDDVLLEILSRLSTSRFAVSCRLVCRRWHNLISTFGRNFISRFVTNHVEHHGGLEYQENSNIFLCYVDPRSGMAKLVTPSRDLVDIFNWAWEDLFGEEGAVAFIHASFNDLLLCSQRIQPSLQVSATPDQPWSLFICNLFTQNRVSLPPTAGTTFSRFGRDLEKIRFGLVCDQPYLRKDSQGKYQTNGGYRCRAVCMTEFVKGKFVVEICDPKAGANNCSWQGHFLSGAEYGPSYEPFMACDGWLHWFNGTKIVALDPFTNQIFFIDVSELNCGSNPHDKSWIWLGACTGSLRVVRVESYDGEYLSMVGNSMTVWKLLKGNEGANWRMYGLKWLQMFPWTNPRFIALHPSNEDILYFGFSHDIFCSILTEQQPMVRVPNTEYDQRFCGPKNVHPVAIPWWPTSL